MNEILPEDKWICSKNYNLILHSDAFFFFVSFFSLKLLSNLQTYPLNSIYRFGNAKTKVEKEKIVTNSFYSRASRSINFFQRKVPIVEHIRKIHRTALLLSVDRIASNVSFAQYTKPDVTECKTHKNDANRTNLYDGNKTILNPYCSWRSASKCTKIIHGYQ